MWSILASFTHTEKQEKWWLNTVWIWDIIDGSPFNLNCHMIAFRILFVDVVALLLYCVYCFLLRLRLLVWRVLNLTHSPTLTPTSNSSCIKIIATTAIIIALSFAGTFILLLQLLSLLVLVVVVSLLSLLLQLLLLLLLVLVVVVMVCWGFGLWHAVLW